MKNGGMKSLAPLPHFTASLIAFTGLARTALLAGLAANFCFCLVNGLMPSRAGRAGFLWTAIAFRVSAFDRALVFFVVAAGFAMIRALLGRDRGQRGAV